MKITTRDILAVLRKFEVATDNDSSRSIDQVVQSHPSPTNQLVSFRFHRARFYILLDETAEDDGDYILKQLQTAKSDLQGTLLLNPTAHVVTHGLPYKGKDAYLFRAESDKRRLDQLLAERYPEHSRSTWQKYIKSGHVSVNDTLIKVSKTEVGEIDDIVITTLTPPDFSADELPIIHLDDYVIVVDKPAGVLTHSKGVENDEFTVAEFFRRYTTDALDSNRPGIVHRLDRDTSGVIIGGRTPEASLWLKSQFSQRRTDKYYLAIVDGIPKIAQAKIDLPIDRNPSAPGTFRVDSKGKEAQTDYEVLATVGNQSLVKLHPHSGRTHQLRVHLRHIGTPIVGDRVYGKAADRLYLHAYKLGIDTAPGQRQQFTSPVPPEFAMHKEFADAIAHLV